MFDNEKWAHPVAVAPFRIAATPVTNAEYAAFVDDGGYRRRELWSRRGWQWRREASAEHPLFWVRDGGGWAERRFGVPVPLEAWHPVVHVNWYEAEAWCRWAGRRLPTEAEWEMAATVEPGTGRKRRFPWGDEIQESDHARLRMNQDAGTKPPACLVGLAPVSSYPEGRGPHGLFHTLGNTLEWTDTMSGKVVDRELVLHPRHQIVAGSWWDGDSRAEDPDDLSTCRLTFFENSVTNAGFRCAKSVRPPDVP